MSFSNCEINITKTRTEKKEIFLEHKKTRKCNHIIACLFFKSVKIHFGHQYFDQMHRHLLYKGKVALYGS